MANGNGRAGIDKVPLRGRFPLPAPHDPLQLFASGGFGVLTHRCASAHVRVGGLDPPVGEYSGLDETAAASLANRSNCATTNRSAKLGPLSCSDETAMAAVAGAQHS